MRGHDHSRARRHFIGGFHKNDPALAKSGDNMWIVDDLVVHIDRRPKSLESCIDSTDGSSHASAKTARTCQYDAQCRV